MAKLLSRAQQIAYNEATKRLAAAKETISTIAGDLHQQYEDMLEKRQENGKGEKLDEVSTTMEEKCDELDEIISDLESVINEI